MSASRIVRTYVASGRHVRSRIALFLAILGPGLIAGLSDDDPAGITTYAVMGADHGYALLWVLVVATAMLVLYHLLGVRIGSHQENLDGLAPRKDAFATGAGPE